MAAIGWGSIGWEGTEEFSINKAKCQGPTHQEKGQIREKPSTDIGLRDVLSYGQPEPLAWPDRHGAKTKTSLRFHLGRALGGHRHPRSFGDLGRRRVRARPEQGSGRGQDRGQESGQYGSAVVPCRQRAVPDERGGWHGYSCLGPSSETCWRGAYSGLDSLVTDLAPYLAKLPKTNADTGNYANNRFLYITSVGQRQAIVIWAAENPISNADCSSPWAPANYDKYWYCYEYVYPSD